MAVLAAAVHPSPASPSPPPPRRARSRLASAAADAVMCLFLASMWLLLWALGAWHVGRIACGEGCPVAVAAGKVFVAAGVTLTLVLPLGVVPLMAWQDRIAAATDIDDDIDIDIDIDIEAVQAPAPKSSAAALRETLRDPVVIGVLASMAFSLLLLAGFLLRGDSTVNGSRRERVGSAIYDVGALGMDTVNCFFVCPILTVRIWRIWRA